MQTLGTKTHFPAAPRPFNDPKCEGWARELVTIPPNHMLAAVTVGLGAGVILLVVSVL